MEQLKFDIVSRLDSIERGDKIIVFIDSFGNLASKRESENALNENSAEDMTRAKNSKGLWRIVTPYLAIKDIPCVAINHVYDSMGMFPQQIMSSGTGIMLSSNTVIFIGKSQEKEGSDLVGYNFTMNIEKSRFVREKSKFIFTVKYEGGIQKYSGLMDIALDAGVVIKPSNGYYQKINLETGEPEGKKFRMKETDNSEFWDPILKSKEFTEFVHKTYKLGYSSILSTPPQTIEYDLEVTE
jgi:hypothetical protein